ncbi:MarR family winged helix-turn-helix transcriptional regulator [Paenibacillus sp. CAU 1782]
MNTFNDDERLTRWLSLSHIQSRINDELERALQEKYGLSLKEFYVLHFISQTEEKKLRLQQLQEMVDLSQSAVSRLVGRMEAKNCGALQRHVCEDDRRGIYTCITEYGEEKLQKALQTFNEVLQSALSDEGLKSELQTHLQKL